MPLILDTGCKSLQGKQAENHDAVTVAHPAPVPYSKPAVLAIADTVDESDELDVATLALSSLSENIYAAPLSWSLKRVVKESFNATNNTLVGSSNHTGATTLSALVLHKHHWVIGHVGDTRVWLLRDARIRQLTHDHTLTTLEMGSVVTSACGLNTEMDLQILHGDLQEGDIFLLTSDGIHDVLNGTSLLAHLIKDDSAETMASNLVQGAITAGSADNVSACVAKVEKLPDSETTQGADSISALPVCSLPHKGDSVDGFQIRGLVHKGRLACIYKASDQKSDKTVALRFPIPGLADDSAYIDAFLREEWIGKRMDHTHFVKAYDISPKRRTVLYSVLEYRRGENLGKRIDRKGFLEIGESLYLIKQLLEGLVYLHKQGVMHRDIKPGNMLVDKKKQQLSLIGFGLSSIEQLQDRGADTKAYSGTKSYMAPELLVGHESDQRADIYSAGVTLYRMITGHLPYGSVTAAADTNFNSFTSAEHYIADIPEWLQDVMKKACAVNFEDRFSTAVEFLDAVSNPPVTIEKKTTEHIQPINAEPWQWMMIGGITALLGVLVYLFL
ncbi:MAG: protein kinase [Acidiferrobacterales bacterium]